MIHISQDGFKFEFDVNTPGFAASIETNFGDGTGAIINFNSSPFTFLATSDSTDGPFNIVAAAGNTVIEALLSCFRFSFFVEGTTIPLFTVNFPVTNPCQFPSLPTL